jgi:hypothetical protein
MKFKDFLQEEYNSGLKSKINRKPFEVFENPTGKEIMETGRVDGSIRWVANSKVKMIFIWPGNADLHENVIPDIEPKIEIGDCIFGSGIPKAGKILVTQNDNFKIFPNTLNLKEWEFSYRFFYDDFEKTIKTKESKNVEFV